MKHWLAIERIPGFLASAYEKASRMVIEGYYALVAEEIVSTLPEGTILDLGTGPGYLPVEIAKKAPDIKIVGIDLTSRLIRIAQGNAEKAGVSDRLTFRTGNAARLDFENASFDMVISTGMLHSLKEPVKVIKEIYRVLKKGGQAWIYDPAKVTSMIDIQKWKASLTYWEKISLWVFRLLKLYKPIETYDRDEVVSMIEATEFKDYHIDNQNEEIQIKLRK